MMDVCDVRLKFADQPRGDGAKRFIAIGILKRGDVSECVVDPRNSIAPASFRRDVVLGTGRIVVACEHQHFVVHPICEPGSMRELVRRGLTETRGNYRALLKLFGISSSDYKRFLNFLAAHDCRADFREFRNGVTEVRTRPAALLPPRPATAKTASSGAGL